MDQIHRDLVDAGFTKAMLYTADGPEQVPNGSLPELPAVVNFAPGNAKHAFETLHKLRPNGPIMAGEWWDGWFDFWGGPHHTTNAKAEADELSWILSQGASISIYMFHGGTNFGWMNGANMDNTPYRPDVTSYDYDAALDESGRPTPKYFLFRDAITEATGNAPPPVPDVAPPIAMPPAQLNQSVSLWQSLPQPLHSEQVLTMEDLDQAYGYILYRTIDSLARLRRSGPRRTPRLRADLLRRQADRYPRSPPRTEPRCTSTSLSPTRASTSSLRIPAASTSPRAIRGERQGITKQGDPCRQPPHRLANLFPAHGQPR